MVWALALSEKEKKITENMEMNPTTKRQKWQATIKADSENQRRDGMTVTDGAWNTRNDNELQKLFLFKILNTILRSVHLVKKR